MPVAFGLQTAGYTPTELTTEAAITLISEGQGFRLSRSALSLRATVPNIDDATFARLASDAEKNCPVSRVLNAEITLDAKLIRALNGTWTLPRRESDSDERTVTGLLACELQLIKRRNGREAHS